jgi:hypothetical protein
MGLYADVDRPIVILKRDCMGPHMGRNTQYLTRLAKIGIVDWTLVKPPLVILERNQPLTRHTECSVSLVRLPWRDDGKGGEWLCEMKRRRLITKTKEWETKKH